MKANEWSRVSTPIAEVLPSFRTMRRGLVRESEWVAECFFADSSAFSKDIFYLEAFVLPLFVPTELIYFNYGFRVGAYDAVTNDVVKDVGQARDRLAKLASLDGLDRAASGRLGVRDLELRMYLAILRDRLGRANDIYRTIAGREIKQDWEQEVKDRAARINGVLDSAGRAAVIEVFADHRSAVRGLLR